MGNRMNASVYWEIFPNFARALGDRFYYRTGLSISKTSRKV